MTTFILYQISLGEKSRYFDQIAMWPRDTDILMNWDDEEFEWLQDPTLTNDAERCYDEFLTQWDKLYKVLRKYPEQFAERDIALNKFEWVYVLLTNRCFGSNFLGIYQMAPFADFLNHENVDTGFDCVDEKGESLYSLKEKDEEEEREAKWRHQEDQNDFITHMKKDLLECEIELRKKMAE